MILATIILALAAAGVLIGQWQGRAKWRLLGPRDEGSRAAGALVWLRGRPVPHVAPASARRLFWRNLLWGIALLPLVGVLVTILMLTEETSSGALQILMVPVLITLYALVPAVTGGVLYLAVVDRAARRWPRRARAIAVGCLPLIALGTVPWGMWPAFGVWQIALPVAAGLLIYGATLQLPGDARAGAPGAGGKSVSER